MKNTKKKMRKGFSLIELVIVVAIIGILALMIIPQFNKVTDDAMEKTWNANCQQVVSAIAMYQAAHAGAMPAQSSDLDNYINGGWASLFDSDNNGVPSGSTYEYDATDKIFSSTFGSKSFSYPSNNQGGTATAAPQNP